MAKEAKNKTPKEAKKNSKDKRHFWKDFKAELKKVIWPTPKQLLNNTVAVITIVLITAVIVFVLDICFEFLNKNGIDNLKKLVTESSNQVSNQTENTTDGNTVDSNETAEGNNTAENGENPTE